MKPSLSEFYELGNWCDIYDPIDTALYVYGSAPIAGALFLSFQMRRIRKQMNFYQTQASQKTDMSIVRPPPGAEL